MTNTTRRFKVGDRVQAVNDTTVGSDWRGAFGTISAIIKAHGSFYRVDWDGLPSGGTWGEQHLVAVEIPPAPWAKLPHGTSRKYAAKARSRLLTAEQNGVLDNAAAGKEVDVAEFRKAATAALSLAATRAGQSMARREWTREARHLIYWADAILDQHLKGLPIYEPGARSPRIAELEQEVLTLKKLCDARQDQSVALKDADERLVKVTEERDGLHLRIGLQNEMIQGCSEGLREARETLDQVNTDRAIAWTVLAYALEQASPEFAALVTGYWDGIADAYGQPRAEEQVDDGE